MNFSDWFQATRPAFDKWGSFVVETIKSRVRADIGEERYGTFFKIEPNYRVKTVESAVGKVGRKSYAAPCDDMTDLVGARFVVLLRSDIEVLDRAIINRSVWSVSKDRDYINESLLDPSAFDYQSMHYLVRNSEAKVLDGIVLPEGLACEVQVRSLLQHAYAELVHDDIYKADVFVPDEVKRLVARSMALMESTDAIFLEISREIKNIRQAQNDLFFAAKFAYRNIGSEVDCEPTDLFQEISDTYRDLLNVVSMDDLARILRNPRRVEAIRSRAQSSSLFSDPVCLLVYWLVENRTRRTFRDWPRGDLRSDLEQISSDLGIAPP